jgi:putative two-component system response regulator
MTVTEVPYPDARMLVVDDQPANVRLLERLLLRWGYQNVVSTTDSSRVVGLVEQDRPDLLLLDLAMPHPDGFEVMRLLSDLVGRGVAVPILVLTADISTAVKQRALAGGASDFLTKPFDEPEVRLRVQNLLRTRMLQVKLEQRVEERTRELEQARRETLERLALAGEFRDDETHEHALRVGRTAQLLAARLDLAEQEVELIGRAAPLHDIGKLGVPDAILLKPGRLTADEFAVMKEHTLIGARILAGSVSAVLRSGEVIARSHHERWDGGGYPDGLSGEQIPLAGRLVAVADVFDALTHERPYKVAWPQDEAVAEIRRVAGEQFDPDVVRAFDQLDHTRLLAPLADIAASSTS